MDGLPFFTPMQRVPVGTAILKPEEGITEDTISPCFKPITIRGLKFQNRVWVAPMCMYSCEDGMFSDFHVAHYGQWAIRGSALITIEASCVTERVSEVNVSGPELRGDSVAHQVLTIANLLTAGKELSSRRGTVEGRTHRSAETNCGRHSFPIPKGWNSTPTCGSQRQCNAALARTQTGAG